MTQTTQTNIDPLIRETFSVSEEDVEAFRKQGYLPLRGIFGQSTIEKLTELNTSRLTAPNDNYGSGFSRLKYDVGNDHPFVLDLISQPEFGHLMQSLTGQDLFFTQGLGFELEQNKSTGFPWHVGTQSFGFQRESDSGYTMWIPLTPIDATKQRGGMAYIGTDKLSGRFIYQHIKLVTEYAKARSTRDGSYSFANFSENKNSILNSSAVAEVLDEAASEDSFAIGDAFIFDKYVLHRSVPLLEGPIKTRLAYALRFSSTDARYDKDRVDSLAYPRKQFNYDVGSKFNDEVCAFDGDVVYDSPYFDSSRDKRTLRTEL